MNVTADDPTTAATRAVLDRYELTLTANDGGETVMSSIETFLVRDGQIIDVWNAEHTQGPWA